ncbi:MAG: SLC13 family permease, partial [Myxococcota bacterium]
MELSAVIVATAALACVVLFVSERVAPALVAGAALAFLAVTGILSPGEALSGFSSTATVAVGSMFVISAGLRRTGVVRTVGAWLSRMLEAQPSRGRTGFFTGASLASAFINNTAVMAILMPVAIRIARRTDSSPSRWLMPLSFASMFGGVCTLLGTSTNLVASSVLEEHGYPGFAFFELAPVGLAFVGVGLVYVRWLQKRLPERRAGGSLTHSFSMHSYLSRARILSGSPLIGKRLDDRTLLAPGVEVVSVGRGGNSLQPREDLRLREGDALYICGPRELLRALEARDGLSLGLTELTDDDLENRDTVL